tara:strand:+ start:697 stop:1170 length:474 start_codon:yes stop_codon:yes gene_type:complete
MKKLKSLYTLLLFASILLLNCNTSSDYSGSMGAAGELNEVQLKLTLEQKECNDASQYIRGTISYEPKYKNLLSMKVKGLKLKCKISNNASIANFKDIKALITFKSKTGATILKEEINIYEFIAPNSSVKYKTEIEITNQQYKDIESFEWSVIDAKCS